MPLFLSDDPARDAERYEAYRDAQLERLPKCHCCGKRIQDDEALHYTAITTDFWLCLGCIDDNTELIEVD